MSAYVLSQKRQYEDFHDEAVKQPDRFTEKGIHEDIRLRLKHYFQARREVLATKVGSKEFFDEVYKKIPESEMVSFYELKRINLYFVFKLFSIIVFQNWFSA
jgi:hypothetical protein